MNKRIVFKYELNRLLLSKEYMLLLAATLAYSVSLLRTTVLYGRDYTAPFSQWTFSGYYLSVAPILFILLLLLCARQLKPSERRAEIIVGSTPMVLPVIRLLRYGAIACAFLIAAALPILFCFALYRMVFDYTDVGILFWLGILHLVAPAILLFGLVMLAGRKKETVVYIMIAAVLIVHIFEIPIPGVINNSGSTVAYDNVLTPAFIVQQAAYAAVGAACVAVSLFLPKKSRAR